jgi:uncharacterized membrane protein
MPSTDPESALDRRLGQLMRAAVGVAAALFAVGAVDYALRHPHTGLVAAVNANPIATYLSIPGLYHGIVTGHAQPIIVLGLLVLVATTVLRVAVAAAYFAGRNERESAALGGIVTGLLLVGLFVIGPLLR